MEGIKKTLSKRRGSLLASGRRQISVSGEVAEWVNGVLCIRNGSYAKSLTGYKTDWLSQAGADHGDKISVRRYFYR